MDRAKISIAGKELQLLHSQTLGAVLFHGNSMRPFLQDGDELIVVPIAWGDIRVGDIITFKKADKFPTYRVRRKSEDKIYLKPDNWEIEIQVSQGEELGKVIERRRKNKKLRYRNLRWHTHAVYARLRNHFIYIRSRFRSLVRRLGNRLLFR